MHSNRHKAKPKSPGQKLSGVKEAKRLAWPSLAPAWREPFSCLGDGKSQTQSPPSLWHWLLLREQRAAARNRGATTSISMQTPEGLRSVGALKFQYRTVQPVLHKQPRSSSHRPVVQSVLPSIFLQLATPGNCCFWQPSCLLSHNSARRSGTLGRREVYG